ncbi:Outer membrane efflux protein [Planktothrix agardhii]|jgi:outer membrane protein TolC|uniref:Outer membrane efflux protein n=1 Tax=Planktothrix agardhii TaxID=1160 RepID=A0A1J1JH62_PLAAG|nr:TolC family protein [Planktothrix agardhii]BBD54735.1 outer membrane efflux protein [Planktothrix agardhii NIES-204]MBG0746824.1 TolC family protein [Planktothrix agardhii KL2]MCF3577098.1 TolC family protein [Planktothrix agardhii 1812]MCF3579631.1 TolC family protein [Planktothrix agardhii 1811]CAD5922092.1 Outer membrane efflux protein [Planktothrix agardhii]
MSVLRNLMAVGVSGAITLINVGPGTAVPSPIASQDKLPDSNTTQPQDFQQNSTKSQYPAPEQAETSLPAEILTSTFKQNPTKSQSRASSPGRRIIDNLLMTKESVTESSIPSKLPAPVFKQNPTKTAQQPAPMTTASTGVEATPRMTPAVSNPTTAETPPTSTTRVNPVFNLPHPLGNNRLSSQNNSLQEIEVALPNPSTQAATLTDSVNRVQQSQPTQLAQVSRPALTVPDLTPPTTPFPPPTPNGTLQTNPPRILLPSSDPLYRPTLPEQVNIEETVPVTLQQAIDLGIRNNENASIAQLQVEQSLAAVRETQANLYPSLVFRSGFSRNVSAAEDLQVRAANRTLRVNRFNNVPGANDREFQTRYGTYSFDNSFQLQYDLGINGLRGARIKASEEQLRILELRLETALEEIRFNVARSYYNLQEADAAVEIQAAAVRNSQKSLEDAEALERAGVGTRFEVLQARVTLANNQQDLTNSQRNQFQSRRELAALLNIDENTNLLAADPIALAGAWDLTLEETIVQAYQNRAELEEQLAERDRAQQLRRAALAATRPNVTVGATYNVLGRINDNPDYRAVRGWADGYDAQVQLSWNFFDGGAAKAQARQRELDIGIADERFNQLLNQIRLDAERAYYDLQANFDNIQTSSLGVEEATEALRLARLRFQAGVGTQLEVINQETDLTRAQNRLLNAIIGYNRALSALQRAVSNLPGNILSDYPL